MSDRTRHAVVEDSGGEIYTLRVFGDDPLVFSSKGPLMLVGFRWYPAGFGCDKIRVLSMHENQSDAIKEVKK